MSSALPLLLIGGFGLANSQTPADKPFRIVRLDPALDEIIAPDAKLETLGEHFGLTEGPVWIPQGKTGYLLFSDNAANVIYKWMEGNPLSVSSKRAATPATK